MLRVYLQWGFHCAILRTQLPPYVSCLLRSDTLTRTRIRVRVVKKAVTHFGLLCVDKKIIFINRKSLGASWRTSYNIFFFRAESSRLPLCDSQRHGQQFLLNQFSILWNFFSSTIAKSNISFVVDALSLCSCKRFKCKKYFHASCVFLFKFSVAVDVIQRDDPGAELVFGINGEGGVPLPSFNTIETAATIVLNQNNNNQLPQPTTSQSPQIQQNNNDSNTQKPNPGSTMNTNGRNGNGSNGRDVRRSPRVVITEQPAQKGLRFRYECEGRSAGSIPGANNTAENRTYPSIQIVGYRGRAIVVVSCVTKDPPYK